MRSNLLLEQLTRSKELMNKMIMFVVESIGQTIDGKQPTDGKLLVGYLLMWKVERSQY